MACACVIAVCLAALLTTIVAEDATYFVLAPKIIRPNMPLNVLVTIQEGSSVSVRARITDTDDTVHDTADENFQIGQSKQMNLNAPSSFDNTKKYFLEVTGTGDLDFSNKTELKTEDKSVSVFIQTDKAMYKPGQTVKFRIVSVHPNLKPYTGELDIELYDANSNKIKQWLKKTSPNGVYQDEMPISVQPVQGDWTFKVSTLGDVVKKNITIAEYVLPKYEVSVNLPSYLVKDTILTGTVSAKYTHGEPVKGSAKVHLMLESTGRWDRAVYPRMTHTLTMAKGEARFSFGFSDLKELFPSSNNPHLEGRTIKVNAEVTEGVTGNTLTGNGTIKVEPLGYNIEFLDSSPNTFKPGLGYTAYVKVTQPDGQPLGADVIGNNKVRVSTNPWGGKSCPSRTNKRPEFEVTVPSGGIVPIELSSMANCTETSIIAKFKEDTASKYNIKQFKSKEGKGIQVSLGGAEGSIKKDTTVTFRIKATEEIDTFHYMIKSKGQLVKSEIRNVGSAREHDLPIAVDASMAHQMAPSARIVVFYFTGKGEVINDALDFNVDGAFKNNVALEFDKEQAKPADKVTVTVNAAAGSFVNLLAVDQSVLLLKGGNDITQQQVLDELKDYDTTKDDDNKGGPMPFGRRGKRCLGCGWWPSFSGGDDSAEIFENAGVVVMTDALVYKDNSYDYLEYDDVMYDAEAEEGAVVFLSGRANTKMLEMTDGDPPAGDLKQADRVRTRFPETWLWTHSTAGSDGKAMFQTEAPDTMTSWVASAFAMHAQDGMGVAPTTTKIKVVKPFFLTLNLPYSIKRGEMFELRVVVFNYLPTDQQVTVTLARSEDFKVKVLLSTNSLEDVEAQVQEAVEEVFVKSGDAQSVSFWIQPLVLGQVPLQVKGQTTQAADALRRNILVEAEGVPQEYSESVFMDLSNTRLVTEDISVGFPVSGVIDGSHYLKVTLLGDIMGSSIAGIERLLRMPYGCGEQNMINFAPTIFAMQYLDNTNQATADVTRKGEKFMEIGYQRELTYQHKDGSFSAFGDSDDSGSMWLTSFVTKCFSQASKYIYVDPAQVAKAYDWTMKKQSKDGSFPEPGRVIHTEMQGGSSSGITLTAFTVVSLYEGKKMFTLEPSLQKKVDDGLGTAVSYLESQYGEFTSRPYLLAIITYALTLAESSEAAPALAQLEKLSKTTSNGLKYWTTVEEGDPSKDEGNTWKRHHRQPKAQDIELNSYALMIYAAKKDVTGGLPVMKWLVSKRNSLGGYSSTQDTVMALQALSSYAALMPPNNDVQVTLTSGEASHEFEKLSKTNSLVMQRYEVPNPKSVSKITVTAKGTGYAVVQVTSMFNIEDTDDDNQVKVTVDTRKINRKTLEVKACATYDGEGESGMSIIQVYHLTGFVAGQGTKEMQEKFKKKGVKRVESDGGSTTFYFDGFTSEETCIEMPTERASLVSNLQAARIVGYKYYDPDNSKTVQYKGDDMDISNCDICPTCCPGKITNTAASFWSLSLLLALALLTLVSMATSCLILV